MARPNGQGGTARDKTQSEPWARAFREVLTDAMSEESSWVTMTRVMAVTLEKI